MTNLEKLQSMNKQELRDFLCELFDNCTPNCPGYKYCRNGVRGTGVWLDKEWEDD